MRPWMTFTASWRSFTLLRTSRLFKECLKSATSNFSSWMSVSSRSMFFSLLLVIDRVLVSMVRMSQRRIMPQHTSARARRSPHNGIVEIVSFFAPSQHPSRIFFAFRGWYRSTRLSKSLT